MNKRNELVILRDRAGKLVEIALVPHFQKFGKIKFASDGLIQGSMETKVIPEKFNSLLEWLYAQGKLKEIEQLLQAILLP